MQKQDMVDMLKHVLHEIDTNVCVALASEVMVAKVEEMASMATRATAVGLGL